MAKTKGTHKPKRDQAAMYVELERRRKYPRIVITTPIRIKIDAATEVAAIVHDISIDGLQIRCDRAAAIQLHPSGKFIKEGKGPMVDVQFDLPFKDKPAAVTITCQLYYITVISVTEFAFGLLFRKHSGASAALVDSFIMDQIVPVEDKVRDYLVEPRSHKDISTYMNMQENEIAEVIGRLQVKGEIITFGDNREVKHLKLSAAMATIFNNLERLEQRLVKLENATGKK